MAHRMEITVDELMGINVDLERKIDGLIEANEKLTKENTDLRAELMTVKHEGEYNE